MRWILLPWLITVVKATNYFNIGAIFSPFNADGTQNDDEIQAIAAFMLAIRYVNGNPSLFPGYTVRGTIRMSSSTQDSINAAYDLMNNAFGTGIDAIMSITNTTVAVDLAP